MAVSSDTLINSLFDGRYRIVRKLGAGGMANVYLAEDQELGRRVAIKILNDRHAGDEQFVERFRREAKNAASLSHPNIVSIYDRGEAEGTYYIAMEFLDGRSLKELIVSRGPAPVSVAIDYARQILGALRFAHKNGIVHRDIKPHNVLVDGEGRVKVTDFGIARAGAASQMTEVGSIIGTAQYLSPEQAKGAPVDQTSDLYSLGIVLYELLTGKVPFTGDTPVEIAMKHLSAPVTPPSELRPDIPHDLDSVILRALAKSPAQRYQSADEMDADLGRIARGVAVSPETEEEATRILSRPPTPLPTAATMVTPRAPAYQPREVFYEYDEPVRRRPIWPWLLALLLVVAAGLAGVLAWHEIQSQLNASKPVAVPLVEGMREQQAVNVLRAHDLQPKVFRRAHGGQVGFVYNQDPGAGDHRDKGSTVNVFVSTGAPKTTVPSVKGRSSTDAVAQLVAAHLKAHVVQINSDKPPGTVIAQDPAAGVKVPQETQVRINVSKGPKPVGVPSVVGSSYDSANSVLQAAGFLVARHDLDSDQPAGTVVDQTPSAGSFVAAGTTITLDVSKGPKTSTVPDVTSTDQATAIATLRGSGFNVAVVKQTTTDPNSNGLVLSQSPLGTTQAKPGTTVTITVGKYSGGTTTTAPPPTTTAAPPPTTTTTPTTPGVP